MAKPKITRIKAAESKTESDSGQAPIVREKVALKDRKQEKSAQKTRRQSEKASKRAERQKKNGRAPLLLRPFVALGRYFKESWRELRQVRWPSRKATWKMVFAVIIYAVALMLLISLLDLFFSWLFNVIIG